MGFKCYDTSIPEVKLIEPQVYNDERGCFYETFSDEWFRENVCDTAFTQDNESHSKLNVVRGLHFQKPPFAQSKLVRCVNGGIIDIAVDIRKDSPTFGRFVTAFLSKMNKNQLFIPRGFAHGFIAMSDDTIVQYKVDNPYNKESEGSIKWDDAELGIFDFVDLWFKSNDDEWILSEKDAAAPYLKDIDTGFNHSDKLY